VEKTNSRKFTVAISGPRPVQTANSIEVFSLTGDTSPNVATNAARKRDKRLRLATDELPENFRNHSFAGALVPSERGTGHPARSSPFFGIVDQTLLETLDGRV
jgi:hypothetical protein